MVTQFLSRARADGADTVRLLTNTLASWEFYEKRGFARVAETRSGMAPKTGPLSMNTESRGRQRMSYENWKDQAPNFQVVDVRHLQGTFPGLKQKQWDWK